ncbi:hypothetical protein SZN_07899 [Streptomyces zinciresistens K42]|uniref:Uncharacterized protein n=1 Tax=Streptomyces zinciresistens K42 TaxID=700597 RepID=G2G7W6_9ACTN|nr:hypothetical protein SZN_07899 [Streptomyces zinciresistens K42]
MLALCLLTAGLVGCGGGPAPDGTRAQVQGLLDRRAAAILDGDETAYLRTGALDRFRNLRAVPLADWSYRVTAVRRTGDRAVAQAELRYRVEGYDRAPVRVGRSLDLARDGRDGWYVASERPAKGSAQQLWDQGEVGAVRGTDSLVLGVGQPPARLRAFARLADSAVPAVSGAWGTDWPRHLVLLVPGSLTGMAGLLGAPESSYRGIAAVTTGETDAPANAPADRIIVNPEAYGVLGSVGKQVVLSHEATHVATRAATTPATPLWLSEGYADWAGYRGSGRTPAEAAPELGRELADGRVPQALPTDADFGFGGDANRLARAYESGWMACRMIAERWGEARLTAFYRAVGAHEGREGAVEDALKDVLGVSLADFTADWRDYLRDRLG